MNGAFKEILDKDTENREILNNDLTQNKEELEHTKEEYERIEQALEEINQAIDASKNQVHELRLKNERLEGEINVINQQILNSRQNDKNIQEQIDRINRQRETDRKEMENYQGQRMPLEIRFQPFPVLWILQKEKAAAWMPISMNVRIRSKNVNPTSSNISMRVEIFKRRSEDMMRCLRISTSVRPS